MTTVGISAGPEPTADKDFPPGVSNPARRALASLGITTIGEAAQHSRSELLALHGVGPKAVRALGEVLAERGESFAGDT